MSAETIFWSWKSILKFPACPSLAAYISITMFHTKLLFAHVKILWENLMLKSLQETKILPMPLAK